MKWIFCLLLFFDADFKNVIYAKEDNRSVFCIRTVNDRNWLLCCIAERKEQCLYKLGKESPARFFIDESKNPNYQYTEIEYIMNL